MSKHTPLFNTHVSHNAVMVNFAEWSMPLHYGSQQREHVVVRQDAGVFDVSHMQVIDIFGHDACQYLARLLANNIYKLSTPGGALYSCMLNEQGCILDDLIVYFVSPNLYRVVVNASTVAKDLHWMLQHAKSYAVEIKLREDLAILAIQGPNARIKASKALASNAEGIERAQLINSLKRFTCREHNQWLIARTGYTGEDGVEIILPKVDLLECWQALLQHNILPVGLGARDTLRLEAGLNLYGSDMDEQVTPLESNLSWTVAFSQKIEIL